MKCLKITTSDKTKRNVRYPMINANARRYVVIMQMLQHCKGTAKGLLNWFEPAGRQTKIARDGSDEIGEIA
jgi:hypothetical protein